jgi:hypothetical protein
MDIAQAASAQAASNVQMAASLAVMKKAMDVSAASGLALVATLAPAAQDSVAVSDQAMAALMAELGSGQAG